MDWHEDDFRASLASVSERTVAAYSADLSRFVRWATDAGLAGPAAIDRSALRAHLAVLTAQSGLTVTEALLAVRAQLSHTTHLEVEVDRIDQIEPVLAAGVDTIMLDNFTLDELRDGVALVGGRAIVEASGNVRLDTVRAIAETGVDVISAGALTHSVRSLDLGLDVVLG